MIEKFKIVASGATKDPKVFWSIVQKPDKNSGLYLSCFLKSMALLPVGKELNLDTTLMKWKY